MRIFLNSYLETNLGDDLFVDILLKRYPNHHFYALTTSKIYKKKYLNLHILSSSFFLRLVRKFNLKYIIARCFDLALILGGSMFIENTDQSYKRFYMGKKDLYILGCNFGPYRTDLYYKRAREFFSQSQDVCFRDSSSFQMFKDLPNTRIASDIVFSLPTKDYENMLEKKQVIFSVISCENKGLKEFEHTYIQKMIDMIVYFRNMGYKVILMSFCEIEGDQKAISQILTEIKDVNDIDCYYYRGNIQEALKILATSKIIIASRFHANVLGLLFGKTILPVAYSDKTINTLKDLNFNSLILDIRKMEHFDVGQLNADVLNYHLDIEHAKEEALKHFERLDGRLNEK